MKGTAGDSWMTGQQVKLMMDKDFPESPLSAEVVLDSPQGQNLDRQIQDHEHQNSNSQNPILDQTGCSNLDQNRSEVPRGEKDPGLASGQDADCPDPPGAQNQTLQLDIDHADVSGWDVDQDWDRERTRANQEADPESGGSVPSLVITRATEQAETRTRQTHVCCSNKCRRGMWSTVKTSERNSVFSSGLRGVKYMSALSFTERSHYPPSCVHTHRSEPPPNSFSQNLCGMWQRST
ncbi:uncharacterized protein LOC130535917 isoform X4 [Takifugu flavidus]|uniref:uncharacterized protein LOC130535917 isoform X4 n=1 Tax=Takifugu flavidus TaxID=433684 RepID=UPI002544AF4C|nr:uncharacterized protein LOC130535917 isoform X4 [Takifugu flavidus]